MAFVTRRAGGGWSSVSSPTDYRNVVSNYAAVLAQTLLAQKNTELESKVFSYRNGQLSYEDLKKYMNDRIAGELPGSQRELDLRQSLVQIDEYESKKNRDLVRSRMEAQFAKDGISAAERVQIENTLLSYFKEGTPEHTEQLAVIAKANELARQEANNRKVAKLESELSQGGTDTNDQIRIYKEMLKYAEKGSEDYSNIQSKINELGERRREEENQKKLFDLQVALVDRYKSGGLTDEEKLTINREMQKVADPNSPEYLDLKQNEADLLGSISKSGSGGSSRDAQVEFEKLQAEEAIAEDKFKKGGLSISAYLQEKERILNTANELINAQGKSATPEEIAGIQVATQQFLELKNSVNEGKVVAYKMGGNKILGTLDQAKYYADTKPAAELGPDGEVLGAATGRKVVTIAGDDNIDKEFVVGDDGKFYEVTGDQVLTDEVTGKEVTSKIYSGQKLDSPINRTPETLQGVLSKTSGIYKPAATIPGYANPALSTSQLVNQIVSTPAAPSTGGSKSSKGSSSSSKSSSKVTVSGLKPNTPNFDTNILKSATSQKVTLPKSGLAGLPGVTVNQSSSSNTSKKSSSLGIVDKAKSAVNTVKNILGNIFSKK